MKAKLSHSPVQLDEPLLRQTLPKNYLEVRRGVELLIIFLSSPLLLIALATISVLILVTDRGPVLFRQKRPGRGGHIFTMYKFRTMYVRSDSSYLTLEVDKRVTRTGKFLRRYKLDELPQLINVILGDMSLIGPRPVPLNFYSLYLDMIPHYDLRHLIRPGITGLAQIQLGYTRTIDEEELKLKYDLEYISRVDTLLDIKILIRTFFPLSRRPGVR